MKHSHFFLSFSSFIFYLVFSTLSLADTFTAKIHHIDYGQKQNESDHVMFSDGRVGILPSEDRSSLYSAKSILRLGETVRVRLDKKNRIQSLVPLSGNEKIELTEEAQRMLEKQKEMSQKEVFFTPSSVSVATASEIFRRMRRDYQSDSQCYNRAHVWSHEEWKRSGISTMKIFVFYTRRYIRDYNFYWWFHAIPGIYVGDQLITLDRRYARGPLSIKPWTDIFVRSRRVCPVITRYSTYENNQQTEHCYLHYASMYFWQPRDLSRLERTGYSKTSFISSEVNHAYWEAF